MRELCKSCRTYMAMTPGQ